jgi:uncharacterized membrane protein YesL
VKIEGKFYALAETIYSFFLLNIIWLVMCIPVVTIFPATSAMFGVVKSWRTKKDGRLFKLFFFHFKENFKQSILFELILVLAIFLLTIDFTFAKQIGSPLNMILLPIFILLAAAVLFTFSFLFSVIVHFQENWKTVIKNSFLFAISHLSLTISSLFVTGAAAAVVWLLPISCIFIASPSAYVIYSFCERAFKKVAETNGSQQNGVR